MIQYIIRKIGYSVLVLLGVITVSFLVNFVLPGDPARMMLGQRADEASVRALREQMGLNKPLVQQYITYVGNVARLDFGRSFSTNRGVAETIAERFPATLLLGVTAIALSTVVGITLGVLAALKPNSWLDTVCMSFALLGISLPSFVFGILLLLIFGVVLDLLPSSGYVDRGPEYLVLPMLTLAFRPLSIIARVTRSSMLDTMGQDYIRTARAKGLDNTTVTIKHGLRNALNPVVTTLSAWFASLLAGTYFVEYIFNWPGIGMVGLDAIMKLDYPMIQGTILFAALIFVVVNSLVDIVYAWLDPKVKLA